MKYSGVVVFVLTVLLLFFLGGYVCGGVETLSTIRERALIKGKAHMYENHKIIIDDEIIRYIVEGEK